MIELQPWTRRDMPLLVRLNEIAMTEHLGGPETSEQLERRLRRYTAAHTDSSRMFKVMVDGVPAGSVGFWEREWKGEKVYETGWAVVSELQGRGVASQAMANVVGMAQAARRHGALHAFPSVENAPSNAICRKLGFENLGEAEVEYQGHHLRCNDWRLTLRL